MSFVDNNNMLPTFSINFSWLVEVAVISILYPVVSLIKFIMKSM